MIDLKDAKLTPDLVNGLIEHELYFNLEEVILSKYPELADKLGPKASCTTLCLMVTKNDFTALGTSSCLDPKDYNEDKGKAIAKNRAVDQLYSGMSFAICLANK